MSSAAIAPRRTRWQRFAVLVLVVASIVVGLRVLDGVPPWWLDEPRRPQAFDNLHHFERSQHTRLLLPFVFPDALAWPPVSVVLGPGRGRPVIMTFARADGQGTGLLLIQTLDGDHPVPARFLPFAAGPEAMEAVAPDVPMIKGRDAAGREFLQTSRVVDGRRVVLRWFDPDPVPLVRMTRSLRRN